MKEFKMKPGLGLFIGLTFIFALSVPNSVAQQKTKIAEKITAADTKTETINVGDTEDHIISLGEDEGTNVSTGKHKFMDGAEWSSMGQSDLVKGNGTHQGYAKHAQNADSAFLKYEGKITTTLSSTGSPIITFEGTWSWTKGTGQFENIQGSGTYKGKYISRTIWTAEWEGEYFISPAATN